MKKLVFPIAIIMFFFLSSFEACMNDTADEPVDVRNELSIKWTCTDNDGQFERTYDVEISKSATDENVLVIHNFNNVSDVTKTINATLTGNKLYIASQSLGNATVVGEGTISPNYQRIDWQYDVTVGMETFKMTASFLPSSQPVKKSISF